MLENRRWAGSAVWAAGAALAAWATLPTGCGEDALCTPGAQVECACPAGAKGAQVCNAEGSAFDECDCEGVGPTGSGGSPSGGGGEGPASSSMAAGATGPASSSSGTVMACESACEDSDDDNTNDCIGCVIEDGSCQGSLDTCFASIECIEYVQCIDACGNPPEATCAGECDTANPTGKAGFAGVATCFCAQCSNICAGTFYCS